MALEAISEDESDIVQRGVSGTLVEPPDMALERKEVLALLSRVIKAQETRIVNGRVRDVRNERVRLESVRVLGSVCSVFNNVLRDKDLSEIEKRLEALEHANNK